MYLSKKAGVTDSIINGRPITRTMDLYGLNINGFENAKLFSKLIGFSIGRKQTKLGDAVKTWDKFKPTKRVNQWNKIYFKNKSRKWVRKLPK